MSAAILALALPALANVGVYQTLDAHGGAVLATEEVAGVRIAEELIRVRSVGDGRLGWQVAYAFESTAGRTVEAAFPVTVTLVANPMWPGEDRRALSAIADALAAGPDGAAWVGIAARLRAEPAGAGCADCEAVRRLAAAGPRDLILPADQLERLGLGGFAVRQDGVSPTSGQLAVQVRPVEPHGPTMPGRSPTADAVAVTVRVPVTLTFPVGRSNLEFSWTSPAWCAGSWHTLAWQAEYDLAPGRTWEGPIGRLWVAIDRELLRRGASPEVPGFGPVPIGDELVWEANDFEPGEESRLRIGGEGVYPFGPPAGKPASEIERRVRGAWTAGAVALLPWSRAEASTVSSTWNPLPGFDDGLWIRDMGFGAENAVDGAPGSAWCSGATEASMVFSLPAPATGITVLGGQRNPWRIGPSPCRDPDVAAYWDADSTPAGCLLEAAAQAGLPLKCTLTGEQGSVEAAFEPGGSATFEGSFAAGRYTLAVGGPGDGGRGVCIAEIIPDIVSDLRMSALMSE